MVNSVMGPFDKIKRRNLDYLLIETIKRIGVSNYSLLARVTGLNPETVRYKINKQLTKYGLGVQLNINHAELGMSVGMLVVNAPGGESWPEEMSYLFFEGKVMGAGKYVGLYAVPFRFKKKYMDILAFLKREGKVQDYEAYEASWVRYPTFRPEFYNFDEKKWVVDWKKVDATMGEVGATSHEVNPEANVDYFDIRILKALQENPTVSLAKVAEEMNANARTVRYHHAEHVTDRKFILNSNVRWVRPEIEGKPADLMQVAMLFKGVGPEGVGLARKLLNKVPFTWLEGGTGSGDYFALLDIPMDGFYDTVRYVESHIDDLKPNFSILVLDAQKTRHLLLPDEMFDQKRGWTLPNYRQEMAQVHSGDGK
jgi:Winged helix-turn-helix DNA-binding